MRLLEEHRAGVCGCERCYLEGDDAPVVGLFKRTLVLLVAQAPGATEAMLGIGELSEAVGRSFGRDGVVYVPLPHPSGASTWLNAPENRERLWRSLAVLEDHMVSIDPGEADA